MDNEKKHIKNYIAKYDKILYNNINTKEEEELKMTQLIEKFNNLELPPNVMNELGLKKDWKKKIAPSFLNKVIDLAVKYRDALKELSKH